MFDKMASDIDTRRAFVEDTKEFFDDLLSENNIFRIVPSLAPGLRQAWLASANTNRFSDLLVSITRLDAQQISAHGLAGVDLSIKIEVINYLYDRYILRGGSELLKRLIDAIDNLLESILDAVGAGSGIKELKDAIKGAIEED